MSDYLFLYREKDSDNRDCCAYIEAKNPQWKCDHYFESVNLYGACFIGRNFLPYENIETILTESEYNELIQYDRAIQKLGCGIKKGDERYNKGIELSKNIQHVFDKLKSEEAIEFYNEIIESEIDFMKEEYSLDDADIEKIFDEYYLDYRDRAIIIYVYNNVSEIGYDEACNLGYIENGNSILEKYFNYEKFGEDLVDEDDCYLKLDDGRIVFLSY